MSEPIPQVSSNDNVYERIGGDATFRMLVDRFYAGVASDSLLRPLYPDADLTIAADRLRLFLIQYWGGPATYSEHRGHPRLRLRHLPFSIGPEERDAWLRHMRSALASLDIEEEIKGRMLAYFEMAAEAMRNH